MSVTPFDSALYRDLFGDAEIARLFSDTAEVRAMMLVMGTLAKVQGQAGDIPEISGAFLHRAAMEVQVDPAALSRPGWEAGTPVPALVEAVRAALNAPEHAPYLFRGATDHDIRDTARALRLRQTLMLIETRLGTALGGLAAVCGRKETGSAPQLRVPAQAVLEWGKALLRLHDQLEALRPACLCVRLGADDETPARRSALATALGLADPGDAAPRDLSPLANWLSEVAASGGKIASALQAHSPAETAIAILGPAPLPALMALSGHAKALASAMAHTQPPQSEAQRLAEHLALPQLVATAARSATLISAIASAPLTLTPDPAVDGDLAGLAQAARDRAKHIAETHAPG